MPSEVQILKESKARFEGVIFNQTANLGTNKSTSCKVIDEATGEVIAQSGSGGGGEFAPTPITFTFTGTQDITDTGFTLTAPIVRTGDPEDDPMIINSKEMIVEDGKPEIVPVIVVEGYKTLMIFEPEVDTIIAKT